MSKRPTAPKFIRVFTQAVAFPAARITAPQPLRATNLPRYIFSTPSRYRDDAGKDPSLRATTAVPQGPSRKRDAEYARTDRRVAIKHPKDEEIPRSPIVQGRGGMHSTRTLALFSLENKVCVVTGGARGLGLVMGQAIVASGSDLAIVDMNSEYTPLSIIF
jgi:hypothetical protein